MAIDLAQLRELITLMRDLGVMRYATPELTLELGVKSSNNSNVQPESVKTPDTSNDQRDKRLDQLPPHLRGLFEVS